jgi:C4-dicarboxylate-binding protein DctP
MAMKTKVVDGQENPILNIIQDKTFEVQKYLSLDGHMVSVMAYAISDKFYNSLPHNLQSILVEGSKKAADEANKVIRTLNTQGIEYLRSQGMIVTQPDKSALDEWHKVIFDATQSYVRDQIGNEIVDSLIAVLADQRK